MDFVATSGVHLAIDGKLCGSASCSSFDGSGKSGPKTWRDEIAKCAKLPWHQAPTEIENIHGHRLGFEGLKDNFELAGPDCCREFEREGAYNANSRYCCVQSGLCRTHHQTRADRYCYFRLSGLERPGVRIGSGRDASEAKIHGRVSSVSMIETWARPDDHVQNVIFKTGQLGLAWDATRGHDEGKRSG
jgi:hypothetical protein